MNINKICLDKISEYNVINNYLYKKYMMLDSRFPNILYKINIIC